MGNVIRFEEHYRPVHFGNPYDPKSVMDYRNHLRERSRMREAGLALEQLRAQQGAAKPLLRLLENFRELRSAPSPLARHQNDPTRRQWWWQPVRRSRLWPD
jgi:hypothetical protein